jgi:hypothetical protein
MTRLPSFALILLVAILLLVVIFLALDFKAAFSFTTDDTQVTAISSGEGYAEDPPLVIFVQAPNILAEPLRRALFNRVGTIAPFSTMELIETPASEPGSAALVVDVDRRTYIWTPVYAAANLSVRVAFASDGRVNWDQLGEIDTVLQASPEVRMSGDLVIWDRSLGLISYPGYRNYIAGQISDKVVESIKTQLGHRPAGLEEELIVSEP